MITEGVQSIWIDGIITKVITDNNYLKKIKDHEDFLKKEKFDKLKTILTDVFGYELSGGGEAAKSVRNNRGVSRKERRRRGVSRKGGVKVKRGGTRKRR